MFGLCETREFGLFVAVLVRIAGSENGFRLRADNGSQTSGVVARGRIDDRLGGSFGRIEALLGNGRRGAGNRRRTK